MEKLITSDFRLGIIGGGQLGRMLALKAANWDIRTHCLDSSEDAPARIICDHFQKGNMTCFEDVVSFGEKVDVVTIESDNVNADALEHLESQGKKVYPSAATLRIIQDKGLQREFCNQQGLPVPEYEIFDHKEELYHSKKLKEWAFPYIVKTRTAGYDGKGVFLIQKQKDLEALPDRGLLVEKKVDIDKELTVIAARNEQGEIGTYPVIELFLSPSAYLVDYLVSPACVSGEIQNKAKAIASNLIRALDMKGLLAVEMFLDRQGNIWINECSPRPHNSGHQTIEGSFTSQYEQHLRGILNLPLGSCETKILTGMINLLGEPDASGPVQYCGLSECLKMRGVKLHIYGKNEVKPYRKMGHITILNQSYKELEEMIQIIKSKVKVRS